MPRLYSHTNHRYSPLTEQRRAADISSLLIHNLITTEQAEPNFSFVTRNQEILSSKPIQYNGLYEVLHGFPHSEANSGIVIPLVYDHFLPHHFQFSIHISFQYLSLCFENNC